MSKLAHPTCRTKNWRTYDAALKQRGWLQVWFHPEAIWLARPGGKRGRSATFTDAAIQTCLTLKGERRPGNDPVDCFSPELAAPGHGSGCRCGRRPAGGKPIEACRSRLAGAGFQHLVTPFERSELRHPVSAQHGALHLLIDSTGIKFEGEGEWFAKKHGHFKPRQRRKLHLRTEEDQDLIWGIKSPTKADMLEIKAIKVTGSRVGDAPMLPELLNQIPAYQAIGKVSVDGANDYDTPGCHAVSCTQRLCRHSSAQTRAALAGENARR